MRLLLVVQLLASAAMCGLIFCIQLVHYPMFAQLNPEVACSAIAEHGRRINLVCRALYAA